MFIMMNPDTREYGMTPHTDTKDIQKARTWRSEAYARNASGYDIWDQATRSYRPYEPIEVHLVLGPLPAIQAGSSGPWIGAVAAPTLEEEVEPSPPPAPAWAGFE